MASILISYSTSEGQTHAISARIADRCRRRGHDVTLADLGDEAPSFDGIDGIIVGSSVHYGRHGQAVRDFLTDHRDSLRALPTALFQVSLSSAVDDPERQAAAAAYVDELLEASGCDPDRIALFGGALRYSKYGFLKRLMMKRISRGATGDIDTSRDYEYTAWEEVDAFADDVAAFIEDRVQTARQDPESP